MPEYKILADGFVDVNLDKRGNIDTKTRLKKGDTVEMKESDAKRHVEAGNLVLASEADKEPEAVVTVETTGASDGSPLAEPGPGGALVLTEEGQKAAPEDSTEEDSTEKGDDADVEDDADDRAPEDYSNEEVYSYPDLQALAKRRGLNAGGSRADLEARLSDYDEAQKA
jgi:hypothetical protein